MRTKISFDNAVQSADHTTLVAVKAAGLVDTLLKPEKEDAPGRVLSYHRGAETA